MCNDSTIPLSVLALDYDVPINGWGPLLELEGIEQVEDSLGRVAIPCEDAARLIAACRATEAYVAERRAVAEAEVIAAALADVPRGAPMVDGASAFESMVAAYPPDTPPSVWQELMDEELERGRG